jgi:hypothetical protein
MAVRRLVSVFLVCLAAAASSACLTSDTLVKVKADGSGTIEQILMVNPKTFEGLAAMMGQMAGDGAGAPAAMPSPKDMLDEAKLKEAAARFGKGVRYVSSAPLTQGELQGAKAIFAFDDINTLAVNQSPDAGTAPANHDPVRFRLDRRPDGHAVLTVTMPEREGRGPRRQAPSMGRETGQVPPEAIAMVKPFLEGLRVAIALDVQGTVVKTNAEHVRGSRITLLDLDFAPLLADPTAFQRLTSLGPGASIADVRPLLEDLPGVKVNTQPALSIEFK